MHNALLNKVDSLERCIKQIQYYYELPSNVAFKQDFLKQDAIILNVQRACQLSIDLANITIKQYRLGLPKDSRDTFSLLHQAGILDDAQANYLKAMVGLRNILVHDYTELNFDLLVDMIENRLDDLLRFSQQILHYFQTQDECS